ncbi:MAG: methyltransferase domain-containing protein [Betaproteobacteria bacterium]
MLDILTNRAFYSHYLTGSGIEIGALNYPLPFLHARAATRFVDYLSTEELTERYPSLTGIVQTDIVTSGDQLDEVPDGSVDYIIANHVIEHLVDPIRGLATWHRKLAPSGVLFMAYPLAQYCPDKARPITSVAHMVDEFQRGVRAPNDEHQLAFILAWNPGYFPDPAGMQAILDLMWARGDNFLDDETRAMLGANESVVTSLLATGETNIHHHVFNYDSMRELLNWVFSNTGSKFSVMDLSLGKGLLSEGIFVLRKVTDPAADFMEVRALVSDQVERTVSDWIEAQHKAIDEMRTELQRIPVVTPALAPAAAAAPGRGVRSFIRSLRGSP